jgi:hypothetical protein
MDFYALIRSDSVLKFIYLLDLALIIIYVRDDMICIRMLAQ